MIELYDENLFKVKYEFNFLDYLYKINEISKKPIYISDELYHK